MATNDEKGLMKSKRRRVGIDIELLEKPEVEFLCWFAGFFEGDGHVSKRSLNITQTKEKGRKQCEEIKRRFGGIGTIYEDERDRYENHSVCYTWQISHPKVISQILKWIQPYLDVNTKASSVLERHGIKETVPVWEKKKHYTSEGIESSLNQASRRCNNLKSHIRTVSDIQNIDNARVSIERPEVMRYCLGNSNADISLESLSKIITNSLEYAEYKMEQQGFDMSSRSCGFVVDDVVIKDISTDSQLDIYLDHDLPLSDAVLGIANKHIEDSYNYEIKLCRAGIE